MAVGWGKNVHGGRAPLFREQPIRCATAALALKEGVKNVDSLAVTTSPS